MCSGIGLGCVGVLARALLAHVEVLALSSNLSTNQQRELLNTCCFGALSLECATSATQWVSRKHG
jgi:hypothetical protein